MTGQIDTFKAYVDWRLQCWARETRGGATNLSYPSTNMLHRDHGLGGAPRVQMSDETYITEKIIIEIRKEAPDEAIVLEAVYRGRGRWAQERREDAQEALGRKLSKRQFWAMFDSAFGKVRDFFEALAKCA